MLFYYYFFWLFFEIICSFTDSFIFLYFNLISSVSFRIIIFWSVIIYFIRILWRTEFIVITSKRSFHWIIIININFSSVKSFLGRIIRIWKIRSSLISIIKRRFFRSWNAFFISFYFRFSSYSRNKSFYLRIVKSGRNGLRPIA